MSPAPERRPPGHAAPEPDACAALPAQVDDVLPGAGADRARTVQVAPADLVQLPHRLAHLVRDVRAGSAVVLDVTGVEPAPAQLGLLLEVLWRRVGAHGRVALTGAPPHRELTWDRLGTTPHQVRRRVYGASSHPACGTAACDLVPRLRALPSQRVPSTGVDGTPGRGAARGAPGRAEDASTPSARPLAQAAGPPA